AACWRSAVGGGACPATRDCVGVLAAVKGSPRGRGRSAPLTAAARSTRSWLIGRAGARCGRGPARAGDGRPARSPSRDGGGTPTGGGGGTGGGDVGGGT